MENVLSSYVRGYDPLRPQVCLDEKVVYLLSTPRGTIPTRPGQNHKEDYEYRREGTSNLFVMVEPQAGYRHVIVRNQRTNQDYAEVIRWIVEEGYPDALEIEIIQDNLNTHTAAALYDSFEPAKARRLLDKIRFTYTPKHGSWLNMAEIEIGVFERMCLNSRFSSRAELEQAVKALEAERNGVKARINWQFKCEDARIKLERLYPKLTN